MESVKTVLDQLWSEVQGVVHRVNAVMLIF